MSLQATVVICTYDRAGFLLGALESLLAQEDVDPDAFEILVVDNNCSDDTAARVRELAARTAAPAIRLVHEPAQGLSHARNRGYREARAELVAYLDDDATACPGWLAAGLEAMRAASPLAVGGPVTPVFAGPRPAWFRERYEAFEPAAAAGFLPPGRFLLGGNLLVRRKVLAKLGGFSPRLGLQGAKLVLGEEVDLFLRLERRHGSGRLYYAPGMRIEHHVAPHKLTLRYIAQRKFMNGQARYVMNRAAGRSRLAEVCASTGWLLRGLVGSGVAFPGYPDKRQWVAERLGTAIHYSGRLAAACGLLRAG